MRKAFTINEIDQAVQRFQPIGPDHDFFVDFAGLRGEFQDRVVFRKLNVTRKHNQYHFNSEINRGNRTFLFLAGMRGSGKTSELARYNKLLNQPTCFMVVTCNVNDELNINDVEYMDIVIFQLEKMLSKLVDIETEKNISLGISDGILKSMKDWFKERVNEVNKKLKAEGSVEVGVGTDGKLSLLKSLLGLTADVKAAFRGSYEQAAKVRETFKSNFSDYAKKFNEFVAQVEIKLREKNAAQSILFLIDGLEHMADEKVRHNIIIGESDRIRQIKANTIFTLPIELMKEEFFIRQAMGEVIPFPFIKLFNRDGNKEEKACGKFEEFIFKRMDEKLFENKNIVHEAIRLSGGSPRQLLQILETANYHIDDEDAHITDKAFAAAITELSNRFARFLSPEDYVRLKKLKEEYEAGIPIGFGGEIQDLLERQVIMEYNDGSDKRVNPLIERSKFYQHHVLGQ